MHKILDKKSSKKVENEVGFSQLRCGDGFQNRRVTLFSPFSLVSDFFIKENSQKRQIFALYNFINQTGKLENSTTARGKFSQEKGSNENDTYP